MAALELGDIAHSVGFNSPISIEGYSGSDATSFLRQMLLIRGVEYKLADARRDGLIGGPVHLGVGQEAVAVGVSASLRQSDRVFGAHRSHSHVISLGSSIRRLFAEVLGKSTGLSRGRGGSMHLWDASVGFLGSVPIVAGTVPLAVGAGLAAKMQAGGDVAIAYLGDGAVEEGVVHESLNLARVLNVPVVFIVENNLFASHMHISIRQSTNSTARFALANSIPYAVVDGNDVISVAKAAEKLISRARSGEGPGFIEAVTFRWFGHVDWRQDIDVGLSRSEADLENWRLRDPVSRLKDALIETKTLSELEFEAMENNIQRLVYEAWDQAVGDPNPLATTLLDEVYSL